MYFGRYRGIYTYGKVGHVAINRNVLIIYEGVVFDNTSVKFPSYTYCMLYSVIQCSC